MAVKLETDPFIPLSWIGINGNICATIAASGPDWKLIWQNDSLYFDAVEAQSTIMRNNTHRRRNEDGPSIQQLQSILKIDEDRNVSVTQGNWWIKQESRAWETNMRQSDNKTQNQRQWRVGLYPSVKRKAYLFLENNS